MPEFLSRPNPFFPRMFTVVAFILIIVPFKDEGGFNYFAAAWCALFPWALHALNIRFGVDCGDEDKRRGGSDTGGFFFGDSGGGDGCGGDGGGGCDGGC